MKSSVKQWVKAKLSGASTEGLVCPAPLRRRAAALEAKRILAAERAERAAVRREKHNRIIQRLMDGERICEVSKAEGVSRQWVDLLAKANSILVVRKPTFRPLKFVPEGVKFRKHPKKRNPLDLLKGDK